MVSLLVGAVHLYCKVYLYVRKLLELASNKYYLLIYHLLLGEIPGSIPEELQEYRYQMDPAEEKGMEVHHHLRWGEVREGDMGQRGP